MVVEGEVTKDFDAHLAGMDRNSLSKLLLEAISQNLACGNSVSVLVVSIRTWLKSDAAILVRYFWNVLSNNEDERFRMIMAIHFALPREETYEQGRNWVNSAENPNEAFHRLGALAKFDDSRRNSFQGGELATMLFLRDWRPGFADRLSRRFA